MARGRFAPSPTGLLHIGSARTALAAWLAVRSTEGEIVWRIEDLDPPRAVTGSYEAALRDLGWLGLDWDEGPDVGGPHEPYRQSERTSLYDRAIDDLVANSQVFPCRISRKDLQDLATAPHGSDGELCYPSSLRPTSLSPDWYESEFAHDAALRFKSDDRLIQWQDRVFGPQAERLSESCGDFVLRRRDGLHAYQLAVVVDDISMGIDQVVRGQDLLASTARQIRLFEELGARPPDFAHLPLVVNAAGEKLSKRDASLTLESVREAGVPPTVLTGYLAYSLGIVDAVVPLKPNALIAQFNWDRIRKHPWIVEDDLANRLLLMP